MSFARKAAAKSVGSVIVITPINEMVIKVKVRGTSPYVQNKFSKKALDKILDDMSTPQEEKTGKKTRKPRNYADDMIQAQHVSVAGWHGIPIIAFKDAMVAACRTSDAVMMKTKMIVDVLPDGFDKNDGTPLVRLYSDEPPLQSELPVRNDNGVIDIRIRPMWKQWEASVTIRYDADRITPSSIVNLLNRAGRQVGVGEGRKLSKKSCGMGWGEFEVVADEVHPNEEEAPKKSADIRVPEAKAATSKKNARARK